MAARKSKWALNFGSNGSGDDKCHVPALLPSTDSQVDHFVANSNGGPLPTLSASTPTGGSLQIGGSSSSSSSSSSTSALRQQSVSVAAWRAQQRGKAAVARSDAGELQASNQSSSPSGAESSGASPEVVGRAQESNGGTIAAPRPAEQTVVRAAGKSGADVSPTSSDESPKESPHPSAEREHPHPSQHQLHASTDGDAEEAPIPPLAPNAPQQHREKSGHLEELLANSPRPSEGASFSSEDFDLDHVMLSPVLSPQHLTEDVLRAFEEDHRRGSAHPIPPDVVGGHADTNERSRGRSSLGLDSAADTPPAPPRHCWEHKELRRCHENTMREYEESGRDPRLLVHIIREHVIDVHDLCLLVSRLQDEKILEGPDAEEIVMEVAECYMGRVSQPDVNFMRAPHELRSAAAVLPTDLQRAITRATKRLLKNDSPVPTRRADSAPSPSTDSEREEDEHPGAPSSTAMTTAAPGAAAPPPTSLGSPKPTESFLTGSRVSWRFLVVVTRLFSLFNTQSRIPEVMALLDSIGQLALARLAARWGEMDARRQFYRKVELPPREDLLAASDIFYQCIQYPAGHIENNLVEFCGALRDLFVRALVDGYLVFQDVEEGFFQAYYDDAFYDGLHKYCQAMAMYRYELSGNSGLQLSNAPAKIAKVEQYFRDIHAATTKHYPPRKAVAAGEAIENSHPTAIKQVLENYDIAAAFATLTGTKNRSGPDARGNQDAFILDCGYINGDYCIKFGVFDGHGMDGQKVSQFLRDELLAHFGQRENLHKMRDFYLIQVRMICELKISAVHSGATFCFAVWNVTKDRVRVWNSGDSALLIAKKNRQQYAVEDEKLRERFLPLEPPNSAEASQLEEARNQKAQERVLVETLRHQSQEHLQRKKSENGAASPSEPELVVGGSVVDDIENNKIANGAGAEADRARSKGSGQAVDPKSSNSNSAANKTPAQAKPNMEQQSDAVPVAASASGVQPLTGSLFAVLPSQIAGGDVGRPRQRHEGGGCGPSWTSTQPTGFIAGRDPDLRCYAEVLPPFGFRRVDETDGTVVEHGGSEIAEQLKAVEELPIALFSKAHSRGGAASKSTGTGGNIATAIKPGPPLVSASEAVAPVPALPAKKPPPPPPPEFLDESGDFVESMLLPAPPSSFLSKPPPPPPKKKRKVVTAAGVVKGLSAPSASAAVPAVNKAATSSSCSVVFGGRKRRDVDVPTQGGGWRAHASTLDAGSSDSIVGQPDACSENDRMSPDDDTPVSSSSSSCGAHKETPAEQCVPAGPPPKAAPPPPALRFLVENDKSPDDRMDTTGSSLKMFSSKASLEDYNRSAAAARYFSPDQLQSLLALRGGEVKKRDPNWWRSSGRRGGATSSTTTTEPASFVNSYGPDCCGDIRPDRVEVQWQYRKNMLHELQHALTALQMMRPHNVRVSSSPHPILVVPMPKHNPASPDAAEHRLLQRITVDHAIDHYRELRRYYARNSVVNPKPPLERFHYYNSVVWSFPFYLPERVQRLDRELDHLEKLWVKHAYVTDGKTGSQSRGRKSKKNRGKKKMMMKGEVGLANASKGECSPEESNSGSDGGGGRASQKLDEELLLYTVDSSASGSGSDADDQGARQDENEKLVDEEMPQRPSVDVDAPGKQDVEISPAAASDEASAAAARCAADEDLRSKAASSRTPFARPLSDSALLRAMRRIGKDRRALKEYGLTKNVARPNTGLIIKANQPRCWSRVAVGPVFRGGLNLARGFGDCISYTLGHSLEPDFFEFSAHDLEYIVCASDGVWDYTNESTQLGFFARLPSAEEVVQEAQKNYSAATKGACDDTTAVTIRLIRRKNENIKTDSL